MSRLVDVSVVIATRNRPVILRKALEKLDAQTKIPREIIIVDGSDVEDSLSRYQDLTQLSNSLRFVIAKTRGAASQRNEGVAIATMPFVLFMDDDVYLENDCIEKLFTAISERPSAGGVSAMITNQKYLPMGRISTFVVSFLAGEKLPSYAGKLVPPGWGMLPEDREGMPEVVQVEWLNLGATIYRKQALPNPPFNNHFYGYSMMEDITLSATIARNNWTLWNARTARIYHDSQPGEHKKRISVLSRMELRNRYFVMKNVMNRHHLSDYWRLVIFEVFGVISTLNSFKGWRQLPAVLVGKTIGIVDIVKGG